MRFIHRPVHRRRASSLFAIGALILPAVPLSPSRGSDATVVTGRVTSDNGQPLGGAAVTISAVRLSAVTESDGRYTVTVAHAAGRAQVALRVAKIGYEPRTVIVFLRGDTVRADVRLAAASVQLGEVVVGSAADAVAWGANRAGIAQRTSPMPAPMAGGVMKAVRRDERRRDPGLRYARADSGNTEAYDRIDENPFRSPRVAPLSTFSVDVDRASYGNVRRFLSRGQLPPRDAVRIEELVNYFPYDDPAPPAGGAPLRVTMERAAAPWNPQHDLVRIALRARDVDMRRAPPSNLVFLVDVSGSMSGAGRLPLVKQSLALLVNELREDDHVAIVVYAGSAGLVLPSTSGAEKQRILAALDGLEAGGSTAGGAGIRLAYDVAQRHFIAGGSNRVILCTDGDFNVGQSSDGELVRLIEDRRQEGAFLTILGFGMGNYKDARMEKLAGAGNGNYAYIDGLLEARKMLVREMGGTLLTVAKDVKLQVEFNPGRVQAYRLIGYEDRLLRDEDFANDARDAGDVGAGHTVTVLYEVVPAGSPLDVVLHGVAPLRYQRPAAASSPGDEMLHVALRYKAPDGDRSTLATFPLIAERRAPSEALRFASAVAEFGMLLRQSPLAGTSTWSQVLELARGARGRDEDGYRAEFIRLAQRAADLAGEDRSRWR